MTPFDSTPHPTGSGEQLWLECVEKLAQELPEQQFNTWIKPLQARVSEDQTKITILVGNRFKLDWVRTQYAQRLSAILQELQGHPIALELALSPREAPPRPAAFQPQPESFSMAEPVADAEPANGFKTRLNSALTFDSLVEGSANRMARAAAMHVATIPGQLYNPLFIYGGVGLGKTHLVHAVGNKLLQDRPDAKVLYIHAEQFVSDVVKAYQRKTFDEFKTRYHSLDLLLIDDVQFFANKERTQEEFFNAFEALLAKKYSRFNQKDISIPLAREALRDLLSIQNRQISVENIQKTVADYYKIKVADMYSKKRPTSIARPRQIAMYLAKELTQKSLPEIGELFGGRDHTTVLHAVRKISGERHQDNELNQQLHVLEQTLKG